MGAAQYDLEINQGATLSKVITVKTNADALMNLTSYTARLQVRPSLCSPILTYEMTTTNSRIVNGGALGTLTLTLTATETAAMTNFFTGNEVYDLEIVSSGGTVTRIMEGKFLLKKEVTR